MKFKYFNITQEYIISKLHFQKYSTIIINIMIYRTLVKDKEEAN